MSDDVRGPTSREVKGLTAVAAIGALVTVAVWNGDLFFPDWYAEWYLGIGIVALACLAFTLGVGVCAVVQWVRYGIRMSRRG